MDLEMTIYGFTLDHQMNMPVAILKDQTGDLSLPVWISNEEAVSMAVEIISRNIFHKTGSQDLLSRLFDVLSLKVSRIGIDDVKDGILSASVTFDKEGEEMPVPVRPSEAMLLSLRYQLPLMVPEDVLHRALLHQTVAEQEAPQDDARDYIDFLEKLNPETLGKYPM